MTDEQINAVIAELCGWTEVRNSVYRHRKPWGHPPLNHDKIKLLPDYCTDLNAMHEAERMFIGPIESQYAENLVEITNADWMEQTRFFCATARQRAEAFLRTLGKWEATTEQSSVDHLRDATKIMEAQP